MAFVKLSKSETEYSGESFTRSISRKSGAEWDANDTLNYEMLDTDGNSISDGNLTKSSDNLTVTFSVPSADTTAKVGKFLILIHLKNSADATLDDVIAEYHMTYEAKKPKG